MNILKATFAILFGLIVFAGCKSDPKTEQLQLIKQTESELYGSESFDKSNAVKLVDLYYNFSEQYPNDTLAAVYLYKAAEIAMNTQLSDRSIAYFDKLLVNYPEFEKAPECLFLKAFVYENQLNDIEKAGKLYKDFIEKYPEHPLVKDAEASIKFLGKSPEELVKIFQEMNAE